MSNVQAPSIESYLGIRAARTHTRNPHFCGSHFRRGWVSFSFSFFSFPLAITFMYPCFWPSLLDRDVETSRTNYSHQALMSGGTHACRYLLARPPACWSNPTMRPGLDPAVAWDREGQSQFRNRAETWGFSHYPGRRPGLRPLTRPLPPAAEATMVPDRWSQSPPSPRLCCTA